MPEEWTTHADGVGTAISTAHDLDGALKQITVQLDSFRVREWPESEDKIKEKRVRGLDGLHYDDRDDVYVDHADGAHATLRFRVAAGTASLVSIEPDDGSKIEQQHMHLLPAAERLVTQLEEVNDCKQTLETLAEGYHEAGDVFIEQLDG